MNSKLKVGMEFENKVEISDKNTAHSLGSGCVLVYATPLMILQMEQAALEAVKPYLDEGITTVGTVVNIEHCGATPVGGIVRAKATLKEIDRRRLVFDVLAWDENEVVGKGTHERFIVETKKFVDKSNAKIGKGPSNCSL